MRILGIDPGYERLGVAILQKEPGKKEQVLFSECFKTPASLAFPERLSLVKSELQRVVKEYRPEAIAVETLFLNTNHKTAMRVSEVRGVILETAQGANLTIFEATPPQIKMATTGYGRASKKDIIKMIKMLVEIPADKTSDDELDAIAIGITGLAHLKL